MPGLQSEHWNHPAMRILKQGIRRERILQTSFAAVLLLLGAWLTSRYFPAFSGWLGTGLIGGAIYWLLQLRLWIPEESLRIPTLLQKEPEKIVWVYGLANQLSPYGFRFTKQGILYFKLANGDETSVSLPADQLKLVSRFLNRILPHATFGYSPEKAKLFHNDPERLRRVD